MTPEEFSSAAHPARASGAGFPLQSDETLDQLLARLEPMFFDLETDTVVTNKSPGAGEDILLASANDLYDGVSMRDIDGFQERYPLNSRLVKRGEQLTKVVAHLDAAIPYATEPMESGKDRGDSEACRQRAVV